MACYFNSVGVYIFKLRKNTKEENTLLHVHVQGIEHIKSFFYLKKRGWVMHTWRFLPQFFLLRVVIVGRWFQSGFIEFLSHIINNMLLAQKLPGFVFFSFSSVTHHTHALIASSLYIIVWCNFMNKRDTCRKSYFLCRLPVITASARWMLIKNIPGWNARRRAVSIWLVFAKCVKNTLGI